MEWELSKENYQPLRTGRKTVATDCGAPLAGCPRATDAVEEKRRDFWKEIAEYDGEDPLEVWIRFIKWVQETFTAGGHQSELVPLLERCTRELQGRDEYKDDARYLRVWLQYADCLPEPRDVFNFLRVHDIGQGWSMYYESHATYLELRGNFKRAEEVYTDGMNRRAQPEARLRAKLKTFQHRMEERRKQKAEEEDLGPSFEQQVEESRNPLGSLSSHRRGAVADKRPLTGLATRGLIAPSRGSARPNLGGGLSSSNNRPSGGLAVFEDGSSSLGVPSFPSAAGATHWTKLESYQQTRKENEPKATAWNGVKIPQRRGLLTRPSGVSAASIGPSLEIPVDEDLAAPEQSSQPDVPARTLRQRLDGSGSDAPPPGSLAEKLLHNPLMFHKSEAGPQDEVQSTPASENQPGLTSQPVAASTDPKGPVYAWDETLLVGENGAECCVEEARARRHNRRPSLATRAPAPSTVAGAEDPAPLRPRRALGVLSDMSTKDGAQSKGGLQILEDSPGAAVEVTPQDEKVKSAVESGLGIFHDFPSGPHAAGQSNVKPPRTRGGMRSSAASRGTVGGEKRSHGFGLQIFEDVAEASTETHRRGSARNTDLPVRDEPGVVNPNMVSGLHIRADTEVLVESTASGMASGVQAREVMGLNRAGASGGGLGLQIREDTGLVPEARAGSGLQMREDTDLIRAGHDGLQLREDTDLRGGGNTRGGLGLQIREDTDLVGGITRMVDWGCRSEKIPT